MQADAIPAGVIRKQKVQRAQTCAICGKYDGVTLTWAVPLDEDGLESGWNVTALCADCRRIRAEAAKQESGANRWESHVRRHRERHRREWF